MSEQLCQIPPDGWWCSREPGHEGPCAARPIINRDAEWLAIWRAVSGPHAQLTGPLIRFGGLVAEAAAQERELLRGAMAAQDEREAKAGERCGVSARVHGCDWPDAVADALIASRQRVRELEAAAQQERARLLTIAVGLVNGYHNDGTHLSAAETLRAIADALGPAMDPPPTSARDLQAEGDELFGEAPTPEDR